MHDLNVFIKKVIIVSVVAIAILFAFIYFHPSRFQVTSYGDAKVLIVDKLLKNVRLIGLRSSGAVRWEDRTHGRTGVIIDFDF